MVEKHDIGALGLKKASYSCHHMRDLCTVCPTQHVLSEQNNIGSERTHFDGCFPVRRMSMAVRIPKGKIIAVNGGSFTA